jgi:hypothetical protein
MDKFDLFVNNISQGEGILSNIPVVGQFVSIVLAALGKISEFKNENILKNLLHITQKLFLNDDTAIRRTMTKIVIGIS